MLHNFAYMDSFEADAVRRAPFPVGSVSRAAQCGIRVCMKRILLLVSILLPATAASSDTLTLSVSGYDSERKIVANLYAQEIAEARPMPTTGGEIQPTVAVATVDLNRDGKAEIIARLLHPTLCGSRGCKLVILAMQPNGAWKEIAWLISHGELEIHDEYRNDYRTITFDRGNKIWAFQNGKYQ